MEAGTMVIAIDVLKAYEGDCILITLNDSGRKYRILVDGGVRDTYNDILKDKLHPIFNNENEQIDLLVITHIDDDHIGGIKELFEDSSLSEVMLKKKIKNVWFNSAEVIANFMDGKSVEKYCDRQVAIIKDNETKISKSNANSLEREIKRIGIKLNIIKIPLVITDIPNTIITMLSPTTKKLERLHREWPVPETKISSVGDDYERRVGEILDNDNDKCTDSNNANGASIAFILEFKGKKILMLGDAHDNIIRKSLESLGYSKYNKLKVDVVKISHHGSNNNTSKRLIEMIECYKYIISSDGSRRNSPGKKCICRIIKYSDMKCKLYFNYEIIDEIFINNFTKEEKLYKSRCIYLTKELEV